MRMSKEPRPEPSLRAVLPRRVSEPPSAILKREIEELAVLTAKRYWPSGLMSTQQGAVCLSAKGEAPMEVSTPRWPSWKAEMVPLLAPAWALLTKSCEGW